MPPAAPNWLRRLDRAAPSFPHHGWTTAAGPDFLTDVAGPAHAAAVAQLVAAVDLDAGAWVRQVHGGVVLPAETEGCLGEADALWTSRPGLGVVGRSADCPLILVTGSDAAGAGRWGFAHASWRSTIALITTTLIGDMKRAGLRPDRATAVICPSAGPCCYEVGSEVVAAAMDRLGVGARDCFPVRGTQTTFDLWRANAAQMEAAGLAADRILVARICTICGDGTYPSHRREQGRAGRFAAIAGGR